MADDNSTKDAAADIRVGLVHLAATATGTAAKEGDEVMALAAQYSDFMAADPANLVRFRCLEIAAAADGGEPKTGAEVVAIAEKYVDFVVPAKAKDEPKPAEPAPPVQVA